MNGSPATIDVLIPAFNAERTIRSAVDSIRSQTLLDLRIIVVDDGSIDDTPAILRGLEAEDERVFVITRKNSGIVGALNEGLARSNARYIARHDADDIAYPGRLACQLQFLETRSDYCAVGCNADHVDENNRKIGMPTNFREIVIGDAAVFPSAEPYLLHPFLMVRREALIEAGGYRYCFHSEDTDLYWRLAERGSLANIRDVLGAYRLHAHSVSSLSIVNGRVAAVSSQLAALSHRRRQAGVTDIEFNKEALETYQSAKTFEAILDLASHGLSDKERSYLELASAAKLAALSLYRAYRLDRADCQTIRRLVVRHFDLMSETNQRHVVIDLMLPKRRRTGRPRETIHLIPWAKIPQILAAVALRKLHRLGHKLNQVVSRN